MCNDRDNSFFKSYTNYFCLVEEERIDKEKVVPISFWRACLLLLMLLTYITLCTSILFIRNCSAYKPSYLI
jgi:hypothetical protein